MKIMEHTLEELRNLTRELEINGAAQEDSIFELIGQMSKNEDSVKNEIEKFQEQFNETHGKLLDNSKKVMKILCYNSLK